MPGAEQTTRLRAGPGTASCIPGRVLGRRRLPALLALLPASGRAEEFPAHPVRVIVPYAPGGGTDIVTRLVAQQAGAIAGQSFAVENRGGGASVPGTQSVISAPPDGYTVGMMDLSLLTNPALLGSRLPYDVERDVTPIGAVALAPPALVAHPGSGAQGLGDLLAQAQARAGRLPLAHAGNGTASHLAAVLLQAATGLRFALVAYRGAGPATAAVVAGEVSFGLTAVPTAKPHVEAATLRALAVAGTIRNPALPGVPCFAELGWPQVDVPAVYGVIGPARLPEAKVQRLNALLVRPAAAAPLRPRLEDLGYAILAGTPEDYAALVRTQVPRWRQVIASAGVSLE